MKKITISINVSEETYNELEKAKNTFFYNERKKDPEIRRGWKGYFLHLFRKEQERG